MLPQPLLAIALAMVGLVVGLLVVAKALRLAVAIFDILRNPEVAGSSKAARVALAALVHSGLWSVVTAGAFAYFIHSKAWAVWIFAGFGAAIAFLGGVSIYFAHKSVAKSGKRAA